MIKPPDMKVNAVEISFLFSRIKDKFLLVGPPYSLILKLLSGSMPTDRMKALTECNVPLDCNMSCKLINILLQI